MQDYLIYELFRAIETNDEQKVKQLIKHGVNLNTIYHSELSSSPSWYGKSPLNLALDKEHHGIAIILKKNKAHLNKALRIEVTNYRAKSDKKSCLKNIQFLLKHGADLKVGKHSCSNIFLSGLYLDESLTSTLIKAGVDVNAKGIGITPLMKETAHVKCKIGVVRLFLEAEAHINIFDNNGFNALTYNALYLDNINKDIFMLLLAAGDRPDPPEKWLLDFMNKTNHLLQEKKQNLQHRCRETIRAHLLKFNNINLFCKVPKLPLPSKLKNYLLYHQEWRDYQKC